MNHPYIRQIDHCRACKASRVHVIVAVDPHGSIAQVQCDFCGSRHRYRGGERGSVEPAALVSERERRFPVADAPLDLELLLRRGIREETGLTPVAPAEKW